MNLQIHRQVCYFTSKRHHYFYYYFERSTTFMSVLSRPTTKAVNVCPWSCTYQTNLWKLHKYILCLLYPMSQTSHY